MNINKNIVMQLLSVMGCEIKGFKNDNNVMGACDLQEWKDWRIQGRWSRFEG